MRGRENRRLRRRFSLPSTTGQGVIPNATKWSEESYLYLVKQSKNKKMKKNNVRFLMALCALFITNFCFAADVQLPQGIPATQYLITDYGASTTNADNATAINAAIAAAKTAGGGTVVFPAGTFLSGPLTINMNELNLYFEEGDTLRMLPYGTYPGTTNFIYIQNCSDIAITGSGVIDGNGGIVGPNGNGYSWWTGYNTGKISTRPVMVRFKACHRVLVDGITLRNAPNQHLVMGQSSTMGDNATISNITAYADVPSPNTDCIDTWWWDGINIVNCNLSGGDDNIAMNSYTQNITIKHCVFGRGMVPSYLTGSGANSTGHGCSIGSYTTAVQNVEVDSCSFNGTDYGIRIKSDRDRSGNDDAHAVQNLTYSNITMTAINKYPIYMTCYYNTHDPVNRPDTVTALPVSGLTPLFRNILLKNITSDGSSAPVAAMYGLPEMPISNVTFDNVQLTSSTSSSTGGMIVAYVDSLTLNCSSITLTTTTSGRNAVIKTAYLPWASTIIGIDDYTSGTVLNSACDNGTGIIPVNRETVSCYPNPTFDNVTITAGYPIDKVTLYSATGALVKSISGYGEKQLSVDMSDMPRGYYFARVLGANNAVTALKIMKK